MSSNYIMRWMTYFNAPITNKVPLCTCTLQELHSTIVHGSKLREATERVRAELAFKDFYKEAKKRWLPMVTPMGIFSYASMEGMIAYNGLGVLDFDGLESQKVAEELRDELFNDPRLRAELAFISPSGRGVKLFIPSRVSSELPLADAFRQSMQQAWDYTEWTYGVKADRANIDLCRGCLVSYDQGAKFRIPSLEDAYSFSFPRKKESESKDGSSADCSQETKAGT